MLKSLLYRKKIDAKIQSRTSLFSAEPSILSVNKGLLGLTASMSLGEVGYHRAGGVGRTAQEPHKDRKHLLADGLPAGFKMYHAKAI